MSYIWQSIKTTSYWRYAILSTDGAKTFFAVLGSVWTLFEILGFFNIINKDDIPGYTFYILLALSLIVVILTRRPIYKFRYTTSGKDLSIEVRIGNIFDIKGQKVISTNTTFDTDISNGIIAPESLQGQFTKRFFPNNVNTLDTVIDQELASIPYTDYTKEKGKNKKYPIGTSIRIDIAGEIYYWLAMSELNYHNTSQTTLNNVLISVESLFSFIAQQGENTPVVIPLIGTGRGRISESRKNIVARIAQIFIKASISTTFSSKLIIIIHPDDAKNFSINLHEVRDLLNHYLS